MFPGSNFTSNTILIHSENPVCKETFLDRKQKNFSDLQFSISYQMGEKTLFLFIPHTNQLINKEYTALCLV